MFQYTARAYAAHGATVILLGKTIEHLEEVYDQIESAGGPQPAIFPFNLETAQPHQYDDLAATIEREFGRLDGADFSGRTVAVFGLGDQWGFSDSFVDAIGEIAEFFAERGAKVVGQWPTDGYEFEASQAVRNGHFAGLALDEDNQPDKSAERIGAWLGRIAGEFGIAAPH